jgi:hypothetical protein
VRANNLGSSWKSTWQFFLVCGTKSASFSCYFVILASHLLLLAAICFFWFLGLFIILFYRSAKLAVSRFSMFYMSPPPDLDVF